MPLLVLLFGKKLTLDSLSKQNNLWENYEPKWRQRWVEKFEKYWNQDKFTELRDKTLRWYQPPNLQFLLLLLEDSWFVCVCVCVCVGTCACTLGHSVMSDYFATSYTIAPPCFSVHGISQARILEWVAISLSRGSSWPRDWTHISCVSCSGRQIIYNWST